MDKVNNIAIIGGDNRLIFTAESLVLDGHKIYAAGFEKAILNKNIVKTDIKNAIINCKYILLPIPVINSNSLLNAPYSKVDIKITDDFIDLLKNKIVFCGMAEKLINLNKNINNIKLYDYAKNDNFAIQNAIPTAEGAIEIAMHNSDFTINNSNCLVTGFGKIGKILCKILKNFGANVTASARKNSDLAWMKSLGYNSISINNLQKNTNYDLIFNTIPHKIFTSEILKNISKDTLIIDLASAPGGIDLEASKKFKINVIQALSLPSKVAPKTAGEIIKNTIYDIIEEEQL